MTDKTQPVTQAQESISRRAVFRGSAIAAAGAAAGAALAQTTAAAQTSASSSRTASVLGRAPRPGRRRLGNLEVSEIGLGVQNNSRTMSSLIPNRRDQIDLIRAAYDNGITFFDCAEAYGPLECERILGEAIEPFRDNVRITTKFGFNIHPVAEEWKPGLNSRPEHIREVVERSLGHLRTNRIDLLYQHRVDPDVPIEDVAGAVERLMDEGKVLHWGLSEPGTGTLRRAHAALPLTAVQNEYSMLYRGVEDTVLPVARELGIGFVPFAPLGKGFLTGAIDMDTQFVDSDYRKGTPRMDPDNREANMALVRLVQGWAARKDATPAQIALVWLQSQAPWIVPIPGTTQMAHMLDNTGAAGVRLTADETRELDADVRAIRVQGARMSDTVAAWSDVEAPLPS